MWELNGEAYNQDDIQFVADQMGISFDEYVKKFNLKKLDDGIEIMEEIDIKSDPFSLDTITDVIGDDFYKIDSKEGSDRINKLLEGSDIEFNRDEAKLVHFAGVGGPMNPPNTYNESNKGRLSYTNTDGEIIVSDYIELDTENPYKIKKNTDIIKNFLKERNYSEEEKNKFAEEKEQELSTFETLIDNNKEVIKEKEENQKQYYNPELFVPYEVTKSVGGYNSSYTFQEIVEPYKEELEATKQEVINSYKKSGKTLPNENKLNEETESLLRERLLFQANLDTNYKATQRLIAEDPSLQDDIYIGALLSEERELSDLKKVQEKVQLNIPTMKVLESAYPKFVNYLSVDNKLSEKDYVELEKELIQLGIPIDPTDELQVQLTNGRTVNQSTLNAYNLLTNKIKGSVATHSSLLNQMVQYQQDASGDKMILSAANKNYDLAEKAITELGVGFADIGASLMGFQYQALLNFTTTGQAINLVSKKIIGAKEDDEVKDLKDVVTSVGVQYNLWSNKMREEYVDDIAFDDAFSSGENFGKFAAQEITKQIPILTTIILSGGAAAYTIGASTAGKKMMDMQTEIATGQKDWKDWEIWAKSLGYGVAEGGFAALSTIPILRAAKNSLATGTAKSVVDNGMKAWWKNNNILLYAPFLESGAEGATQFTQNLIDGVNPMLGVDHAGFTGFGFGILFGGIPFAQSVYNSVFSDYNKNKKMQGLLQEQRDLGRKLSRARSPLMKKEYELQIEENAWRIQEASKEIENSVKNDIRASGAEGYVEMIKIQEELRVSATEIQNSTTLSIEEKQQLIKVLQKKYDIVENTKQQYLNDNNLQLYRPEFVQLKTTDVTRYNSLMSKGRKIAVKDRGPDYRPDKKEIERYAYEAYLEEEIIKANNKAGAEGVSLRQFTTKQEALDYIDRQKDSGKYEEGQGDKAWAIVNEGGDGWADPNTDRSFVVVENQIANQRKNIATHEVGHQVFWKIFGRESKAFDNIAKQLLQTVKISDPNFYQTWVKNNPDANPESDSYNSQEAIMRFIELAGKKGFVLNERRKGLAGFFGAMVQREFKDSFDFKGETDIVDFVVGLAKKIADGTLSKTDIVAAKKSKLVPKESKVDMEKQYDIAASVAPNTLNELAKEYKENVDAMSTENLTSFVNQYRNVALKALGFDPVKGTITKAEAISFVDKYFPNITRGFKPTESQFSTYLTNTILKKRQEFYEKEIGDKSKTTSVDDPRAKQVIADTETVPLQKDIAPTIDPLRLFTDTALKDKFIKTTEKALKDQDINALNYKTLKTLDEDAIADLIGIPAKKIFDPTANLSKEELTKALMFINKNASTLFNLLPKANTDLARVPYLNDPSKTTLVGGDPTGIPRSVLNLFYNKGKRIGNNYQWTKKPGLTVDKFKKSLGIEGNVKSPDVKVRTNTSQAVKGILELTGRALTNKAVRDILTKQGFTPSQVLPIGEGKSDLMFSQYLKQAERPFGDKTINTILTAQGLDPVKPFKSKKDVDIYIQGIENYLFPLAEKSFFFNPDTKQTKRSVMLLATHLRPSNRVVGKQLDNYYVSKLNELSKLPDTAFGDKFKGLDKDFKFNMSKDFFGQSPESIEKAKKDGKIDSYNKNWGIIHKEMWNRIKKVIRNDANAATIIATYLRITAQDTTFWHRLGAEFVGYSTNPKGNGKKKYEYEHAMPATAAYVYLLDSILNGGNFDAAYKAVMDNYKLIALDAAMDILLKKAGLTTSMTQGWQLIDNFWWQRYFNELVANVKGGINPESIVFLDGKTFAETLNINNAGQSVPSVIAKNKQIVAPINNKILPIADQLKGEFTNDMVLDKMAEVDKVNKEKALAFSKSQNLSEDFNKILENQTGIGADKVYSDVKAQVVGANKGKFNFFVPPSAEDFVGLLYKTLGKGKLGDAQMAWYKKNLLDPFATAMDNISRDRIALMNDFKALKKELKIVPKNLKKKLPGEPFTQEQAIRTYIWNRQGMSPEGMSKTDLKDLTDFVESKPELVTFADQLIAMQKGDQYPAPKFGWLAGNITTDLIDGINTIKRAKYLEQWQYNVDEIFTKANLNKLEAAYGKGYRDALENILKRMRTGRNREFTSDSLTGRVTDWLTNSIGAIMFFNTRSAVLQTISAVNFINFKDNNLFAAGKAFANQPQFWKDFLTLFNSDFLVDRRNGLRLNVNETDIADMAKKGGVRGVISEILRIGFLPTQLADSFAIASGGSTFYRNRVKKYTKEGMSEAEAENQAFIDFREIAEEAQQSSRPDRISQQQAGPLGRVILAFANTPMQYTRLIKKAASDLRNGRGDTITNISKIFYYGFVQNLFFNAMQQALFAMGFGDEEEETEKRQEKYYNIVNSMADSILRGAGVGGAIFSVLKNTAIKLSREAQKKSPKFQDVLVKEIAQLSPPVSSKLSKLRAAGRTYDWNKKEMMEKGFSLDNPAYLAAGQVIAATTNIPLDRAFKKIDNIRKASSSDYEAWQRIAMLAGWSDWELGIKKSKSNKKSKRKPKRKIIKYNK